jgi:hypothetical protein
MSRARVSTQKRYKGKRIRDETSYLRIRAKGLGINPLFVTRDRDPENCRVRDSDKTRARGSCSGMLPAQTIIAPNIKLEAF